jgi:glyoxylase-like metal-dependent hydrolase (beta-lactamase superfamily II)
MRTVALSLLLVSAIAAQAPEPNGGGVRPGVLPQQWITGGPKCMEIPDWQVHEYNADLYILRESGCTHYEKPFLYLLFGKERAMLLDTGAGAAQTGREVSEVVAKWLKRNQRTSIPLIVAHTHSHGDHIAGDKQFEAMHDAAIPVTMVPLSIEGTAKFYGIENWPLNPGHIDLGERVIDILPIPGHDKLSLAFYDRQTGILFAGDSLYPGRLYIEDYPAFVDSTRRLVSFTEGKIVAHVLGNHIEESSTPYLDYPIGSMYQPHEHSLELSRAHLLELDRALGNMHGVPIRLALRDFSIWPVNAEVWKEMDAIRKATEQKLRSNMWAQPNDR